MTLLQTFQPMAAQLSNERRPVIGYKWKLSLPLATRLVRSTWSHNIKARFPGLDQLEIPIGHPIGDHVPYPSASPVITKCAAYGPQTDFPSKIKLPSSYVCYDIRTTKLHDDVIKWKHSPRCWTFVREIHRSPVNSPHKGQWRGALMFSFICAWINGWVNNRKAGNLRRHHAHYDVIVILVHTLPAAGFVTMHNL